MVGRRVGKNKAEPIVYPKTQDALESAGGAVNNYQDDQCDWALSLIMMLSPSKDTREVLGLQGRQTGAMTSAYTEFKDPACTQRQLPNKQVLGLVLRSQGWRPRFGSSVTRGGSWSLPDGQARWGEDMGWSRAASLQGSGQTGNGEAAPERWGQEFQDSELWAEGKVKSG